MHSLFYVRRDGIETKLLDSREFLKQLHELGEKYLGTAHEGKTITMDMDGVQIFHDNAISAAKVTGGSKAVEMFPEYSQKNIRAVQENGEPPYCWYAPTVFGAQLLEGLSPEVNRAVGRYMGLIPGVDKLVDSLGELGYDITSVTAGHQEAAEEVSRRVGIEKTLGTDIGKDKNGYYNGQIERFLSGQYKSDAVSNILGTNGDLAGTHIGDSYSDVDTLREVSPSIAFNPGCMESLQNADISVINNSKVGMLPLFDHRGTYDNSIAPVDLPKAVVINESWNPGAEGLLDYSRNIKKHNIRSIVEEPGSIEGRIKTRLNDEGIPYHTGLHEFMSPESFDSFAKVLYKRFSA